MVIKKKKNQHRLHGFEKHPSQKRAVFQELADHQKKKAQISPKP